MDTQPAADFVNEHKPDAQNKDHDFLVVGIGASAGGIKALKEFFEPVPADSGAAFVVILHLSPEYESRLAEVLQTSAQIPVEQVTERVRVEPNRVYVIPPNKSLWVEDGHLALHDVLNVEERRAPVDIFFRTLGEAHGQRAVAVILSGTGANGSMGVRRIKERGGVIFVQEPDEAEYSDMPLNSIATGLVDDVLPVGEIARNIFAYKQNFSKVILTDEIINGSEAAEAGLRELFTLLRVRTGHDFTNYKRASLMRRIERRLKVRGILEVPEYVQYLRANPEELDHLLRDLLISVTNFFRDKHTFEILERDVLPIILHDKTAADTVRVWVAGCATGEEAYSIAMLFAERILGAPEAPSIQIFATDIDENALATARTGFYTNSGIADVAPERLHRFFNKQGEGYRVRREIREMVLFAAHNLLKDPPFSRLDLATCRNLLIYFDHTAQARAMETLRFALNPKGFLLLGSSESLDGKSELYLTINKEHRIFQSRMRNARLPIPIPDVAPALRFSAMRPTEPPRQLPERTSFADLHQSLLEEYAAPSVVINEDYQIVHVSERAGRYLQISGGEPSHNLLKIVRPQLRLELRNALFQAVQRRARVRVANIPIEIDGQTETIDLHVRPTWRDEDTAPDFILVLFEPHRDSPGAPAEEQPQTLPAGSEPISEKLEQELTRIRGQLRQTIDQYEVQTEELRAANEEAQAVNEELRSAAEELETGKEELQSLNEELVTVNQELKIKIEELSQSNNDFSNLMNSTEIGTIFLDRALRIKLFTWRAREIFNLIPADIGRSLEDITGKLNYKLLATDIETVLDKLQTVEREVPVGDDRFYLMRVLPYRTSEDRIDGVVLTFTDISRRKLIETNLRRSEERLRAIVGQATAGVVEMDTDGRLTSVNPRFCEITGYSADELLGKMMQDVTHPDDLTRSLEMFEQAIADGKPYINEKRLLCKDETAIWMTDSVSVIHDALGNPNKVISVVMDVTTRKLAEDALRRSREELELRVLERTHELAETNDQLQTEIVERQQAEDERFALLRQLVTAQEDERSRIARDLHDQLGQQLTALRLKLEALRKNCDGDAALCEQVDQTQAVARQIDSDVNFLAWQLRPTALDDFGLAAALQNFVRDWSNHFETAAEFHQSGMDNRRLAPEIETSLYRIAQEALNNISKHARATRVDVLLERRDNLAVLIIEDNGSGFDPDNRRAAAGANGGLGLLGMQERTALVGGTLEVESQPNGGTTIYARVPINDKAA